MNVQEIIQKLRNRTHTLSSDMSDERMLEIIEDSVRLIRTEIIARVGEEYLYDIFITDIVAGQSEYELSRQTENTKLIQKIISVGVKSHPNNEYKAYLPIQIGNKQDFHTYKARYTVGDNSLFLSETPKQTISEGLRIEALAHPKKLTLSSEGKDLGVPQEVEEIIITVAKMYIYEIRSIMDKYDRTVNELIGNDSPRGWNWMTRILTDRVISSMEAAHLNTSWLK